MRAWRTSEGFLVEIGRTAASVITMQIEELPEEWRGLQEYVQLDEYGIVRRTFDVTGGSVDDDLQVTVYAIIADTFRSLSLTIHTGRTWRVFKDEERILKDLRPVPEDDLSTLELIREGLKSDAQLQLHRLEERRREAKEIVARHPAAGGDADPEFKRVMALVRGRVEAWGLELDKLLLSVLAQTQALRLGVSKSEHAATGALAAFDPAVESILLACRRAAFDRALGRQDPPPAPVIGSFDRMSDPERNGIRLLSELLGELEVRLREEAERQENADALNNAAEFRKAAVHFAQARERLIACLAR